MKKSITILMLSGLIFGCVEAVDRNGSPTSAGEEDFVLRAQNDLDDTDEGIQEPKTKIEIVKEFLSKHRYKIGAGAAVILALYLKKYLDNRKNITSEEPKIPLVGSLGAEVEAGESAVLEQSDDNLVPSKEGNARGLSLFLGASAAMFLLAYLQKEPARP